MRRDQHAPHVFASREELSPVNGCDPVTILVVADSRMHAVQILRRRGLHAQTVERLAREDDGVDEALRNPSTPLWRGHTAGDSPDWQPL